MKNFKLVKVGGTPYEMGYDYGKKCRDEIQYFVKKVLLREVAFDNEVYFKSITEKALEYETYIEEVSPRLLEEIRGIGKGAEIGYPEALMLQCRSELVYLAKMNWRLKNENELECSSFGITKELSANGKMIIGQNIDMSSSFEDLGIILCLYPEEGPAIMTWTLAGTVGQVGLNSFGLARCGNILISEGWRIGLPTTILFRQVLESPTTKSVVNLVDRSYRAKSNNFLIGDRSGEILDIETTANDYRLLYPEDGMLMHTNHYLHKDFIKNEMFYNLKDSKIRLDCMQSLFVNAPKKISLDYLKLALSNHDTDPHSVCVHNSKKKDTKTIASIIMSPDESMMLACSGNPCKGSYERYAL